MDGQVIGLLAIIMHEWDSQVFAAVDPATDRQLEVSSLVCSTHLTTHQKEPLLRVPFSVAFQASAFFHAFIHDAAAEDKLSHSGPQHRLHPGHSMDDPSSARLLAMRAHADLDPQFAVINHISGHMETLNSKDN
jgi:hypothetical protein